jgi:hypothetical protein
VNNLSNSRYLALAEIASLSLDRAAKNLLNVESSEENTRVALIKEIFDILEPDIVMFGHINRPRKKTFLFSPSFSLIKSNEDYILDEQKIQSDVLIPNIPSYTNKTRLIPVGFKELGILRFLVIDEFAIPSEIFFEDNKSRINFEYFCVVLCWKDSFIGNELEESNFYSSFITKWLSRITQVVMQNDLYLRQLKKYSEDYKELNTNLETKIKSVENELKESFNEVFRTVERFSPARRTFRTSFYCFIVFILSIFCHYVLKITIIESIWSWIGLFASTGFMIMALFMKKDLFN